MTAPPSAATRATIPDVQKPFHDARRSSPLLGPLFAAETGDVFMFVSTTGKTRRIRITGKYKAFLTKWDAPCEEMFEFLAANDKAELVRLVRDGELHTWDLTYAAEIAGRACSDAEVTAPLLQLLDHSSPSVREGALLGLRYHLSEEVRRRVGEIALRDANSAVREVAESVLESGA